jgi:NAD(P)-dependent dehydrogenase (short-subunit alcohol dehydrogenase family)
LAARPAADQWLSGLRILVTGAAGVLGRALVEEADRRGAAVVAAGRSPTIEAAALPAAAIRIAADLSESDACRRLVHEAARAMSGLDIVVNNAATLVRKEFRLLELDELEAAWRVNLRAPAVIMQESFEYLRAGTSPAIVNVVSTAGVSGGIATVSAYGMTKAGLIVLTKAVAREYGPHGIRVFALSPPSIDSEMQRSLPAEHRERVRSMNVLGRLAPPEEVARYTLLTASGMGGLVSGTMVDLTATAY